MSPFARSVLSGVFPPMGDRRIGVGDVGLSITVDLPSEVRSALDEVTRAEGVSAVRATGQEDLTDEDVFRLVS